MNYWMQVNMYACSESILHRIWVWTNTFPVSARSASIIFNSDIRRSLDADSASTLLHAFVTSRVDYCNAFLAGAPKITTDMLQRVFKRCRTIESSVTPRSLTRDWHDWCTWWWTFPSEWSTTWGCLPTVSAWQGASVPIKLLHSSRPNRYTAASTLLCTSSADHTIANRNALAYSSEPRSVYMGLYHR